MDTFKDNIRITPIKKIFNNLEKKFTNLKIFDPYQFICKNEKICSIYDRKNDVLFFKDKDHLSKEGSEYLTKYFDKWILEKF